MSSILIVDDDQALCRTLELQLEIAGHEVKTAYKVSSGLTTAAEMNAKIVLLDVNLPDMDGVIALPDFLAINGVTAVIIMTAAMDNVIVVESMRAGAFDYLRKPINLEDLLALVEKAGEVHGSENRPIVEGGAVREHDMVGMHPTILEVHKMLGLLSRSRVTVLILGETGTGKEMAARILHEADSGDKPFVAINCSSVVPTLLESELFGHEKGAFTGADQTKIGQLEFAEDGTLFLDEIGDMPVDLQAKLLRVLQEDEFVRVGGLEPIKLKARIVAATHRDMFNLIDQGKFREDLYYRLTVATVNLPPLREHRSDIVLLVPYLLNKIGEKMNCHVPKVDDEGMQQLINYDWPGNIRELENVLIRAVALAKGNGILTCESINLPEPHKIKPTAITNAPITLADAEKLHIEKMLLGNDWNISKTARRLDISPTTLRKKISDYNLSNN
ncbi:MAG: sigma-54 dependent transcriptional regulator [Thermodesulfobacteriota bacterium]